MKTPFYELAEKIGNDMTGKDKITYHVTNRIYYFFEDYFPELLYSSWGSGMRKEQIIGINLTALLFADLLWQDEMKGGKK